MVATDPAEQARVLQRIGDMGQRPLQDRNRLAECQRRLGLLRAPQAGGHRLIEASGTEQMVGELDRVGPGAPGEGIGRT